MTTVWKFAKYDYCIFKSQVRMLVVFLALAVYLACITDKGYAFGMLYGGFGAIVFVTTPFYYEQSLTGTRGFIGLLPGTNGQRVQGRFLFGNLIIMAYMTLNFLLMAAVSFLRKEVFPYMTEIYVLVMAITCIFNALQFTLMYFIELKPGQGQTYASLLRMVIPFAMFFGIPVLSDRLSSDQIRVLSDIWMRHSLSVSLAALLAALVFSAWMGWLCTLHENIKIG